MKIVDVLFNLFAFMINFIFGRTVLELKGKQRKTSTSDIVAQMKLEKQQRQSNRFEAVEDAIQVSEEIEDILANELNSLYNDVEFSVKVFKRIEEDYGRIFGTPNFCFELMIDRNKAINDLCKRYAQKVIREEIASIGQSDLTRYFAVVNRYQAFYIQTSEGDVDDETLNKAMQKLTSSDSKKALKVVASIISVL